MSRVVDLWVRKDKTRTTRYGKGRRWQAVWTDGRGGELKESHRTKDAAQAWIQEQDDKRRQGFTPGGPRVTVTEAGQRWLTARVGWEAKTRHEVEATWEKRIQPRFGDRLVDQVTRDDLRAWVAAMQAEGLSSRTISTYFGRIVALFSWCVGEKLLPSSPAAGVELPKARRRARHFLQVAEFWALHGAMSSHYQDALWLDVTTGLRPGELWELRGQDVGARRRRLRVERAVTEVDGRLVIGSTKTGEPREVPLLDDVETMLQERAERAGPDGLLFPTARGAQVRVTNFNTQYWTKAVERAGLPAGLRMYDLRHTAASWAIRSGASVLSVQRMLGHATPTETLNTYAHLFEDELDQVSKGIRVMLDRHKTATGSADASGE